MILLWMRQKQVFFSWIGKNQRFFYSTKNAIIAIDFEIFLIVWAGLVPAQKEKFPIFLLVLDKMFNLK